MNVQEKLKELGLGDTNAVVIGSGILHALGLRESRDLDVVVDETTFELLGRDKRFKHEVNHGEAVLADGVYEIRHEWGVLGGQTFQDLYNNSVVIDGVRYTSLEFNLQVKKSWLKDDHVRQKDVDDVALMEAYLRKTGR